MRLSKKEIDRIITAALREDIGPGDVTTGAIIPMNKTGKASFYAKEEGIIAGLFIAESVFKKSGRNIIWKNHVKEGSHVTKNRKIAEVSGSLAAILKAERTALNLLQRLSGIATITSKFVEKAESANTKILDTRKTVPGMRLLDKYAVKCGGGTNHRFGLYDMVLIKDNHIKIAGSIAEAVNLVRKKNKKKILIEVETGNLNQVKEALAAKADIIMLDNMSTQMMKEAVKIIGGKAKTEASGNVNLKNVSKIANTGVDFISVGALTHSVKALDINMKISQTKALNEKINRRNK